MMCAQGACPRCGRLIDLSRRYCVFCGMPLTYSQPPAAYPHQAPATTKARAWRWRNLAIIIGGVTIVGGCIYGLVCEGRRITGTTPHHVVLGQPIQWRELKLAFDPQAGPFMPASGMVISVDLAFGDFDGDQADELFAYTRSAGRDDVAFGSSLFEADGQVSLIDHQSYHAQLDAATWDYNNDGRAELLANALNAPSLQVLDLQGKVLVELPGNSPGLWGAAIGDFDGNGSLDLALEDGHNRNSSSVIVYEPGGTEIWRMALPAGTYNAGYGDADNDGRWEVVIYVYGTMRFFGMDQTEATAPGWSEYCWPGLVQDLDGDGSSEIFASNFGYLNLATGAVTELKFGPRGDKRSDDPFANVFLWDMHGDGSGELVTEGLNNFCLNSELFVFDTGGACVYDEKMGSSIEQYGVLRDSAGVQHLVVLLEKKILIYP